MRRQKLTRLITLPLPPNPEILIRRPITYEPAAYRTANSIAKRSGAPSIALPSVTLRSPSFEDPHRLRFYVLVLRRSESRLGKRAGKTPARYGSERVDYAILARTQANRSC